MIRRPLLFAALLATISLASFSWAVAQTDESSQKKTLTTKDGVSLGITYYPGQAGKDTAPVLMLHDIKESRAIYSNLAKRLQQPGRGDKHKSFAVLTVDLRGHGDSVSQSLPNGQTRELEAAKLRKNDMIAMVRFDMEAVRKFLVTENDAGRLNLNRLSIVGTGLGAMVATNWAAVDWSMRPLATVKQGQDVKALVLVSPRWSASGLSMKNPLRQAGVREKVAMFLLYGGKDRRVTADVNRIHKQLERYHPKPDEDAQPSEENAVPTLAQYGPDTELQGSEWLKQIGAQGEDLIIRFLDAHAVQPDFDHLERRQLQ